MKTKRICLLILIITVFTLAGCMENPDHPIVISKNDGKLESIISGKPAQPLTEKYQAPDTWKGKYEIGDVTVNVDADIYVPDTLEYPVYRVYPDVLSDERLDAFLTYFIGDGKLYWSDYTGDMTKAEIMDEIIKYQVILSDLSNPDSALYKDLHAKMSNEEIEKYKKDTSDAIDRLGKKYAQASVGRNRYEVDRVLNETEGTRNGDYAYKSLMGYTEDYTVFVNISASMPPYESIRLQMMADRKAKKTVDFGIYNPTPAQIGSPTKLISCGENLQGSVTFDEALKAADKAMADLSYDYKMLYAFSDDRQMDASGQDRELYYQFYYTPRLPDSDLYTEFFISYNGEFQMPWAMPYIIVSVSADETDDGDGIIISDICIRSSMRFAELLNTNVPLLDFDDIKAVAEKYLPMTSCLIDVSEITSEEHDLPIRHHVSIDRIRLGYIKVSEKDNLGAGICIPVWMFYGSQKDEYADKEHSPYILDDENMVEHPEQYVIKPFLCINAIDGSIIDLTQGY